MTASDSSNVASINNASTCNVGKKLFITFQSIYGHKFLSLYETEAMQEEFRFEWNRQLKNIPLSRIKLAVEKCRDPFGEFSEFPPTATQFHALCLPDDKELNIPSLEHAFRAVMSHHIKGNEFLINITKSLDIYNLRLLSERDALSRFKPLYEIERKQALREGKVLPLLPSHTDFIIPTRQLTAEEKQVHQDHEDAIAEEALKKLRRMTGLNEIPTKADIERVKQRFGASEPILTAMETREVMMEAQNNAIKRGEAYF